MHDWLVTNAGAEKVLKALIDIYPNADIYSIVEFLNDEDKKAILNNKKVNTSFVQKLPFAQKYFRNYLPLFPKAIESFDLSGYDLIISSSWAFAKGVHKTEKQYHICYCYTPIRYAWDLYGEYIKDLSFLKKVFVRLTLHYIRRWDIQTLKRVDYFIADSEFVAARIKKTYKRDSTVIYPPVDIVGFSFCEQKENFYLTASRLVSYKKTKLIVEAFNEMPDKKLVVIGNGEEFESIQKIAKKNIILLGFVSQNTLIEYMQKARAFVYAAVEDFGIVPIEAMSCGTPVIALNKGGTAETVINNYNGIHFDEQTKKDIIKAIHRFEESKIDKYKVQNSTKLFSTNRFYNEISQFIEEKCKRKC